METELDKTLAKLKATILSAREKHPGNRMLVEALCEEIGEAVSGEGSIFRGNREWLHVACVAIRLYDEGTPLTPASRDMCDRLCDLGDEANAILKSAGVPD